MTAIDLRLKKAHAAFSAQFADAFQLKVISASNGDFGDLEGMQFDSDRCGGYLYFWSSGGIEYQLVDYEQGYEVVPITSFADVSDDVCDTTVCYLIEQIVDLHRIAA